MEQPKIKDCYRVSGTGITYKKMSVLHRLEDIQGRYGVSYRNFLTAMNKGYFAREDIHIVKEKLI